MEEKAYAKVNLALLVKEKQIDGYHSIENIMIPIDFYDTLEFEPIENGIILLDNTDIKTEDNLVYKAAKLFLDTYKVNKGVLITLKKKIPSEAGLAGGSSDAAAVLRGLNKLFELNKTSEELSKLAIKLGSDVPFFIYQKPALCSGRGQNITLIPTNYDKINILLIKPPFGCSTKEIYEDYNSTKSSKTHKINNVELALKNNDLALLKENMFNDLEISAFSKNTRLKKLKKELEKYDFAMMSGSGSTFFIINNNIKLLKEIVKKYEGNNFTLITKLL